MASEPVSPLLTDFLARHRSLLTSLYAESGCEKWLLSLEQFASALQVSATKRFPGESATPAAVEQYLKTLHLQDLCLACACAAGNEPAWEFFVARYRPQLRSAARSILRAGPGHEPRAEELADSLFAELYGLGPTGRPRETSLFAYFHGRSSLSTWLRSVLSQRHVDTLRAAQRTVSLDDHPPSPGHHSIPVDASPVDPERAPYLALLDEALAAALAELNARERMLLAFFYVDEMTLAQIGRNLGEHESTISRQLERCRRRLRELVTQFLQGRSSATSGHGIRLPLDAAQVAVVFEYAVQDWAFDLARALAKAGDAEERREAAQK